MFELIKAIYKTVFSPAQKKGMNLVYNHNFLVEHVLNASKL